MNTGLASADAPDRAACWAACAERWFDNDHLLIQLNIEMLGRAERPILALETALAEASKSEASAERNRLLLECSALSIYWLFGLYEALRTLRERGPGRFAPLADIYREIEVARMPLAKHEVKGAPRYRGIEHYPTSLWDPETGRVGWHVFDPHCEAMVTVVRTDVADRFLTAGEPSPLPS